MSKDVEFQLGQALLASHCAREGDHQCMGRVTIERGKVKAECSYCGECEIIPGWDRQAADKLRVVFEAAGIDWGNLRLDAQIRAIRQFKKETK